MTTERRMPSSGRMYTNVDGVKEMSWSFGALAEDLGIRPETLRDMWSGYELPMPKRFPGAWRLTRRQFLLVRRLRETVVRWARNTESRERTKQVTAAVNRLKREW